MNRVHLCCGTIYLKGYENCDHDGEVISDLNRVFIEDGIVENPNATTIDKYYKFPFEPDSTKRVRRKFIIDRKMNILEKWPWEDGSLDEIVMICAWEHFIHINEIPHIVSEVKRTLKKGGKFITNFPDIKTIVEKYYDNNPFFCMELIYCNHKDKVSSHEFGYTMETFKEYWPESYIVEERTVVPCDHPVISAVVTKQ